MPLKGHTEDRVNKTTTASYNPSGIASFCFAELAKTHRANTRFAPTAYFWETLNLEL
jgi:hypothetical protein